MCTECEFNDLGERLSRLCESEDMAVASAAKTLLTAAGKQCASCRRCSLDDVRISRTASGVTGDVVRDRANREGVTKLPTEIEDTLLRMIATVVGMDDLDVLLVLHVARGGGLASFARSVRRLEAVLHGYDGSVNRSSVKYRWDLICKRFRPLSALRGWGIGHGGRRSEAEETEGVGYEQGELF